MWRRPSSSTPRIPLQPRTGIACSGHEAGTPGGAIHDRSYRPAWGLGSRLGLPIGGGRTGYVPIAAVLERPDRPVAILLVDDYCIESKTGVTRTYHAFSKYAGNPVLVADKPWEGSHIYVYGTVLPDESGTGYRMWYHALSDDVDRTHLASTRPAPTASIGTSRTWASISYNGSTNNNLFIRRGEGDHIVSVIHTPWETDPGQRYKLVNFDSGMAHASSGPGRPTPCTGPMFRPIPSCPRPVTSATSPGTPSTSAYVGYLKMSAMVNDLKRLARWASRLPPSSIPPGQDYS